MTMDTLSISTGIPANSMSPRTRYRRMEKLGEGGQGTVYKAFDKQLHRFVAIKVINQDGQQNADDMRREALTLANLKNPHIVALHDVIHDKEGTEIVMELLEGEDLHSWLGSEDLTLEDYRQLTEQTLEAMVAAHEVNILHRDLKPENIRIFRLAGGRLSVKIMDFGLARISEIAKKQTANAAGEIRGSVRYIAPEQLERKALDARTDLYSLGCIFYKVLSGRTAFGDAKMSDVINAHLRHRFVPLIQRCPELDPGLAQWVEWLMKRNPEERPSSAREALESLRHVLEHIEAGFHINRAIRTGAIPSPTSTITSHIIQGSGTMAVPIRTDYDPNLINVPTEPLRNTNSVHAMPIGWKWMIVVAIVLLVVLIVLVLMLLSKP